MEKNRRLQIIQAAVKRFTKHGLNKTTLDEIARDLRIGKATIYHYFKSKEELFYATIDLRTDEYLIDIKNIFNEDEKTIEEKFFAYLEIKKTADQKYPIIYELMLSVLKDDSFEQEVKVLQKLLKEEKEIIKNVFDLQSKKNSNVQLSDFLVMQSWGFFFSQKLSSTTSKNEIDSKEWINKFLNIK